MKGPVPLMLQVDEFHLFEAVNGTAKDDALGRGHDCRRIVKANMCPGLQTFAEPVEYFVYAGFIYGFQERYVMKKHMFALV